MKHFKLIPYAFLFASIVFSLSSAAQKGRDALPEAEGKANLEKYAATYHDKSSWEKRASLIRQNILKGLQLDPLPARSDLKPIVNNKKTLNGYTVENAAFESKPGFWVTGNIYRPINVKGNIPGILVPQGHSGKPAEARADPDWQKLCAGLAKMGAVVLAYDMIGYSESNQCEHKIPLAGKIQTWNSMRAVDFLLSQKDVDAKRIAITGASGGGTQTFLLTALDKRISVSAPVVMVSAHFFGGCVCESGMPIHSGTTIGTNNAEIAALAAPRPMIVVSDGKDWTKNVPEVEYPYIKNVYRLYNATSQLSNAHFSEEGHDYGLSKRKAVYTFLANQLGLNRSLITGATGEIDESFVTIQPYKDLKVFNTTIQRPAYAVIGNAAVTALFAGK
jgi:dienelactone hydrolase